MQELYCCLPSPFCFPASRQPSRTSPSIQKETSFQIQIDGKPFATYVWQDRNVLRPYFAHLHAPNGKQVTRNYPPVEGKDATDHAAMHPGLWLAFGDLGGADFWRNKGTVKHIEFVEKPTATKDGGNFAVKKTGTWRARKPSVRRPAG